MPSVLVAPFMQLTSNAVPYLDIWTQIIVGFNSYAVALHIVQPTQIVRSIHNLEAHEITTTI